MELINKFICNVQYFSKSYKFTSDRIWDGIHNHLRYISIQEDLEELEEYSISEPNTETDLEISEENRRWGNRGDVKNHSIEVEVYDY